MNELSRTAMVLAAGLGTRMRPMTLTKPKPLQMVGGRTMLDHALDKLVGAGIERAVVNTFYLADQIEEHLQSRRDIEIIISREDELLDTGGAIVKALDYFEGKAFFSLNADLPWIDGKKGWDVGGRGVHDSHLPLPPVGEEGIHSLPSLARMRQGWKPDVMDALLLLMRSEKARGFDTTKGDFAMKENGRVWRKDLAPPRPYVWISAQILKPELFANPPGKVFSNNVVWDRVEAAGRLYGVEHDGTCYHVGTPEDWRMANDLLASGQGWAM